MRKILLAAAAMTLFAPAAYGQSSSSFPEEMDEDIVRSIPAPEEMEDMASTVGRAADAVLDVPIGGVVRAIDPRRHVDPRETIGDMAGRRDPYIRERIRDSAEGLAMGMGDIVAQVAVVAPVLRRSLADLEHNLGRAMREGRRDRDYDRDYAGDYERNYGRDYRD